MLPFSIWVFEGGGGGLLIVSELKIASLCLKLGNIRLGYSSSIAKNYPVFLGEIKLGCREES